MRSIAPLWFPGCQFSLPPLSGLSAVTDRYVDKVWQTFWLEYECLLFLKMIAAARF
jgi:hypothetical protein